MADQMVGYILDVYSWYEHELLTERRGGGGRSVRRFDALQAGLVFEVARRLLAGGGDGAAREAAVRVAIRAHVPAPVTSRRRAFQYRLVQRQNCRTRESHIRSASVSIIIPHRSA